MSVVGGGRCLSEELSTANLEKRIFAFVQRKRIAWIIEEDLPHVRHQNSGTFRREEEEVG